MTRPALRVVRTPDEESRREAVMAAVAELARKYDRHRHCGWERIALGALAPVVAAYRGTEDAR